MQANRRERLNVPERSTPIRECKRLLFGVSMITFEHGRSSDSATKIWFFEVPHKSEDANMDAGENDLRLIAVMRRYFAIKDELADLKSSLEKTRKATGMEVGEFYYVHGDSEHVTQVIRTVTLKKEMDILMGLAEGWARGEIISLDTPSY